MMTTPQSTQPREDPENRLYVVVRNSRRQYSVWPADLAMPAGWERLGAPAEKDACLAHIAKVWTEMRLAPAMPPGRSIRRD